MSNTEQFERIKKRLIQELGELREKVHNLRKKVHDENVKSGLFGDVKGDSGSEYAYHKGGHNEIQFNIGFGNKYKEFRYGLAFSFQKTQSLLDPIGTLKPYVETFNRLPFSEKKHSLWKSKDKSTDPIETKQVIPELDTFWFYGEKINIENERISDEQIKRINQVLNDLYGIYEKTLIGGKKILDNTKTIEALKFNLINNKQLILTGAPGTGKTWTAKQIVKEMLGVDNDDKLKECQFTKEKENDKGSFAIVQFHPSYTYEDFVQGIVAGTSSEEKVTYQVKDKILVEMANNAKEERNKGKSYILILDEINRANLPSVLGELIYALEYRGEEVDLLYGKYNAQSSPNSYSKTISIPENLYIIGTMNTADRSIGHIDYAIRRRFVFIPVKPDGSLINNKFAQLFLFNEVSKLFSNNLSPDYDSDDVSIGHSYFMVNEKDEKGEILAGKFAYQVLPLLKEYYKDGVLINNPKLDIKSVGEIQIYGKMDYQEIFEKLKKAISSSGEDKALGVEKQSSEQ